MALGRTNAQIVEKPKFSIGTAKLHAQHICAKPEVFDRARIAARAVELGLAIPRREIHVSESPESG